MSIALLLKLIPKPQDVATLFKVIFFWKDFSFKTPALIENNPIIYSPPTYYTNTSANYANKLFFLNFIYYIISIIYNITTQNSKNNLLASASGLACFFCSVLAIKRTKEKK